MSVSEYEDEPVRGLPDYLPDDETLIWQGTPDRKIMARRVFHLRSVSLYLAALLVAHIVIQLTQGATVSAVLLEGGWMFALALAAIGILAGLAWAYARATIYTLTNKRLVLRCGVAMQMMVNIPLSTVNSADMRRFADGSGDIVLSLDEEKRLSYILLWPNVKSWQFSPVRPALRSLANVDAVATALASVAPVEDTATPAEAKDEDELSSHQMLGAS